MTCNCNIYDYPIIGITLTSHSVTHVTVTCDVTSHSLPRSKIKILKNEK